MEGQDEGIEEELKKKIEGIVLEIEEMGREYEERKNGIVIQEVIMDGID